MYIHRLMRVEQRKKPFWTGKKNDAKEIRRMTMTIIENKKRTKKIMRYRYTRIFLLFLHDKDCVSPVAYKIRGCTCKGIYLLC